LKHFPQRPVITPGPDFERDYPHPSLPFSVQYARIISILKPVKDPSPASSFQPISLMDTFGKVFENILLAWILHEVSECILIRDKKFEFRPGHTTFLQLVRLFERITRNFVEKRPTGTEFLNVVKPSVPSESMTSSTS
jgi:hypothetical protein